MSTLDVLEVEKFYQTPRGQVCQRMVQQKISSLLSCVPPPQNFLGVGYVSPYLEAVAFESQKWEGETFLFMPHTIGAIANSGSLSPISLVDCHLWPLADCSIDFIFMTHALEHSTYPSAFLREAWRVLKNDGFLLMLVPNRRGLWARTEKTPFGHGHPYTRTQLITLFQNGCFLPLQVEGCLYVPPFTSSFFLSMAPLWEKVGQGLGPEVGGAFLVLGSKNLYAPIRVEKKSWVKYMPVLNKN